MYVIMSETFIKIFFISFLFLFLIFIYFYFFYFNLYEHLHKQNQKKKKQRNNSNSNKIKLQEHFAMNYSHLLRITATYWLNIDIASLQTSSQLKASIYYNNIQVNYRLLQFVFLSQLCLPL